MVRVLDNNVAITVAIGEETQQGLARVDALEIRIHGRVKRRHSTGWMKKRNRSIGDPTKTGAEQLRHRAAVGFKFSVERHGPSETLCRLRIPIVGLVKQSGQDVLLNTAIHLVEKPSVAGVA